MDGSVSLHCTITNAGVVRLDITHHVCMVYIKYNADRGAIMTICGVDANLNYSKCYDESMKSMRKFGLKVKCKAEQIWTILEPVCNLPRCGSQGQLV